MRTKHRLKRLSASPRHRCTRRKPFMKVRKFAISDASCERSPGQDGEIFAGNVIDQRHGGPITIGFGRYAPNQSLEEKLAVDDVMLVLEGKLSVTSCGST